MTNFILCGMQFGDEGKGTFVDYLTHEKDANSIVRYNGGSQASHTVITPSGTIHKFSQLGSGMFSPKCHTYLTENMVINLDNLLIEMEIFSSKTGIAIPELIDRIHIHEDCFVVTPYHKLINKLREFSKGANRRGTVGTGVSEVRYLLSEPTTCQTTHSLGLQVKDIFVPDSNEQIVSSLRALQNHVWNFYQNNRKTIFENVPEEMLNSLKKEIDFLLKPTSFLSITWDYITRIKQAPQEVNLARCVYTTSDSLIRSNSSNVIFEGSQGLLIDSTYGIKPNTTFLDTTNHFASTLSTSEDSVTKIGIVKAFNSRHGLGLFPTESSYLSQQIFDANQEESFWNGRIRFGWFDAILFRYAQNINQVDELFLSSLDILDDFETIKVCNEYLYDGLVDERFCELFAYSTSPEGKIIITDIISTGDDLGKYLAKCVPIYLCVNGWKSDISNVSIKSHLPEKCLDYIRLLEELTKLPITVVSVGPTRNHKIRM